MVHLLILHSIFYTNTQLEQNPADVKAVRDSVVSALLAGRDTVSGSVLCLIIVSHRYWILTQNKSQTASLLSFVTYCLAIHPEVTTKLREEIKATLGEDERQPTGEEIKCMRYCKQSTHQMKAAICLF